MLLQKLLSLATDWLHLHLLLDKFDVLLLSLTLFLLRQPHFVLDLFLFRHELVNKVLVSFDLSLFNDFLPLHQPTIELIDFLAHHDLLLSVLLIFKCFICILSLNSF